MLLHLCLPKELKQDECIPKNTEEDFVFVLCPMAGGMKEEFRIRVHMCKKES